MSFLNFKYIPAEKRPTSGYFIIALMFVLLSCSSNTEKPVSEMAPEPSGPALHRITTQQFEASGMVLGKLEKQPFHAIVKAKGMIDVPPQNRAEVGSSFGGTVRRINLLPGQKVRKGQILFTLEDPEYVKMQQDYLESKGQLAYLESDYNRQKDLAQDNVSSQKVFLKAKSEYEVTRARMASLEKILSLMNINPNTLGVNNIHSTISVRSPIDGFVTDVNIAQGAFLSPSDQAVGIVNTDHIHLELKVFEKELSRMVIGQPIRFRIQEDNSETYDARITLISKNVDPENRTIAIHGDLADEKMGQRLNPGMYVEAEIYTSSEERLALPKDALVDVEGRFYVLEVSETSEEGYSFKEKEVLTGLSNSEYVEVLNAQDFDENVEFLINGAFNLITK